MYKWTVEDSLKFIGLISAIVIVFYGGTFLGCKMIEKHHESKNAVVATQSVEQETYTPPVIVKAVVKERSR